MKPDTVAEITVESALNELRGMFPNAHHFNISYSDLYKVGVLQWDKTVPVGVTVRIEIGGLPMWSGVTLQKV